MTGFGAQDGLALELDHHPQHAVGRRVLGPHVDDHGLVFADFDVDVTGIEVDAFGQTEDGALPPAGARPAAVSARAQLLGALDGLGRWRSCRVGHRVAGGVP